MKKDIEYESRVRYDEKRSYGYYDRLRKILTYIKID